MNGVNPMDDPSRVPYYPENPLLGMDDPSITLSLSGGRATLMQRLLMSQERGNRRS